jgi:predicted transposase YbfD/YdcC
MWLTLASGSPEWIGDGDSVAGPGSTRQFDRVRAPAALDWARRQTTQADDQSTARSRQPTRHRPRRYRTVIAVDGKTLRGARRADGGQVHLLTALVPAGDRTRNRGHGRRETRTVKAITLRTPGGIAFPHAEQAVRITRTRITDGRTSRETAYLTVSLPAADAQPADLQDWIRRHWHIENRLHHVRDVTFREDQHQARTGTGPAVIATLRNTAIGYHRTQGDNNIARANRRADRRSHDLINAVTSDYPTTY